MNHLNFTPILSGLRENQVEGLAAVVLDSGIVADADRDRDGVGRGKTDIDILGVGGGESTTKNDRPFAGGVF